MSFLRQHRVAAAVSVVAAAVAGTLVAVALSKDGYETRHVDLNDGGIWVTSPPQLGLWGRLNKPAGSLDLALSPPGRAQSSYRLDIRQEDSAVTAWDVGAGVLYPVDPATGKRVEEQDVPVSSDEQVEIGGGTIAVLDPKTNRVWAARVNTRSGITSLTPLDPSARPLVKFAPPGGAAQGAGLAVGSDGTVYAATARGETATVRPRDGGFGKPQRGTLGHPLQSVQVSALGTSMVVYDAVAGQVYLPGGRSAMVKADPAGRVQAASSAGAQVAIATTGQLLSVPLGGGAAVTLFEGGTGKPAAPARLDNCVHAAWAGVPGVYARACGGDSAKQIPLSRNKPLEDPVFRVNRGSILLNDLTLGSVYDLATLQQVDDWNSVKPPPVVRISKKNKNNTTTLAARDLPPKANDDSPGARPGRTTVLHVLDNDSDPSGAVLAISHISGADSTAANVQIAPDGQSVEISLSDSQVQDVSFKYTIDDGKGLTDTASVNVQVRGPGENSAPRLRPKFTQPAFRVSAGGTLELPVLDDWRDPDGDPLVVTGATTSAGNVTVTPDGRLNFLAPPTGGNPKLVYKIADGRAGPGSQSIPVEVLGPNSARTSPPIAQPDIARGQVGKPIRVKPLGNDLPGADPTNPNAELAIAGSINSPAGVRVSTDLKSGEVTVVTSRHGTFVLNYTAAYGNAKFGHSVIRVDVVNTPAQVQPPVPVPDTGVLYGQNTATIDVVANDFDPAGGVLVVQHAEPVADNGQLQVAIVGGRFLRVNARQADLAPNPQVIRYTITNGLTKPVAGELTVTQQPPPNPDTPLAVDDYVTVRAGDSALVPVLDNDIDPAGATLGLLDDVPGAPHAGQLTVASAADTRVADLGAAFVSNKQVRYVAPRVVKQTSATISYVARNPGGDRGAGTVHVTIVPLPSKTNPNQAPTAQAVEARVISGDTIRITLPTTNIDPDGDTANVAGITSAPKLGRIVSIGSTSITYEAFPTESGTDRFGYKVSDAYGQTSSATISVGIGTASDPQPPVAVDDSSTAAPGSTVRVDVLANDVIAPDDSVSITSLRKTNPGLPPGTKLIHEGGPIEVVAPRTNGRDLVIQYAVNDGAGDPSIATLKVHSQRGYVPPPIAVDVPATPAPGAASATVDVLTKASDPQGLPLHLAKVFSPGATVAGGSVRLPVLGRVQNVVFEVANEQGAVAAGVIHVPARGVGAPYAKPNKLISVPRDGAHTIDIRDYVTDPAARAVRLTTTDHLATAPATKLGLSSPDTTHLKLTGRNGYNGPAAIVFEVTDGRSLSDPKGQLALISVQVQVGDPTPVVRCPTAPVSVVEGGAARRLDITALCHVWAPNRNQLSSLQYSASWRSRPAGVDILGSGSHVVGLRAGGAAKPGSQGSMRVSVAGTRAIASTVNVVVRKLGKASIEPIVIDGFKAGATATRDLRGYVNSPLADPVVSIVRIQQLSQPAARVSSSGSIVRITPGAGAHGLLRFAVVVTDVANRKRVDRQLRGTITMNVLNVPDAPGPPQAGRSTLSQTVVLSWPTPQANGAQIDGYQVQWAGGSQQCAASPCRVTGLTNGRQYPFTVRAHNAVGYSKPSSRLAPPAKPDKLPAAVAGVTTSNPADRALSVAWRPVSNGGTAVRTYRVSWSGGGSATVSGSARSVVARGLDNHNVYTFTVVAVNGLGAGPPTSTRGQSAGNPSTPSGVNVAYADAAGTTTRTVSVRWNAVDPNGAGQPTYTVTRDGAAICTTKLRSCTDTPATARVYTYSVVAKNSAGHRSAAGSARFTVTGTPDPPTRITSRNTAKDGQLAVSYIVPNSHGRSSRVECRAYIAYCGPWVPTGRPGTREPTHLADTVTNDIDITVMLRTCNEEVCGPWVDGPSAHTDGPPHGAPSMRCSVSNNSTITWAWPRPSQINQFKVTRYTVFVDGNRAGTVSNTQYTKTFARDGKDHSVAVTSIDDRGESGDGSPTASCTTAKPPDPKKIIITMGDHKVGGGCSVGCSYVRYAVQGFTANTGYTIHIIGQPGNFIRDYTFRTDGSGNYSTQSTGYYGAPGSTNGVGTVTGMIGAVIGSCHGDWGASTGCN